MHRSSFERMRAFRDSYLVDLRERPLKILDVGSAAVLGSISYRDLFATQSWHYVGLDTQPGPNVDVVATDPYRWRDFADASFDVVVSGQAFEHIEWPWLTIVEIARVLKPNGLAAITAPSGGHVHRYPTDCWRYYPDGFPALAKYAGLSVIENDVDFSFVFKECAEWGDAFAILQKPAQPYVNPRTRATGASVQTTVDATEMPIVSAPFRAAVPSLEALAKCNALEQRAAAGFAWRWQLARRHLRTAFRALCAPQRLSRF